MNMPFENIVGKGKNIGGHDFLNFPTMFLVFNPFPKRQILDSSKLKEFADDNFKCD